MRNLMRGAAVLLLACALSACGPQVRETRIDPEAGMPAGNGLAVVQAVTNAELLSPQLQDFTSVIAVREGEDHAVYELQREDRGLLRSGVFVGSLPPGRYRLSHLHAFGSNGNAQFWVNVPIPALVGTFDVRPGRLTRLGTLLVQPLGSRIGVDRRGEERRGYLMSRVDAASGLEDYVRTRYPEVAPAVLEADILGWNPDPHELARLRLAARIREFAFGDQPVMLDGDIVIPARLGQVHWRGPQGWKRIETGHTQQLAAVARAGDGVLVGGERGLLLAAPGFDGAWRTVPGPAPDEAIYWMGSAPGGQAYVLTRSGTESRAYRIDPKRPDWTPLKRFAYEPGLFFTGRGVMHARVDDTGDLVLFWNRESHRLRAFDGSWQSGEGRVLWRLQQQPDGTLVALPGSLWSGYGEPEISADGGATWRRIVRPQPGFSLDDVALRWNYWNALPVRLEDGTVLVPGARQTRDARGKVSNAPEPYLLESVPGSKGWRIGPVMAQGCYRLLASLSSARSLYALCTDGRMVRSDDGGVRWVTERESAEAALTREPEAV